MIRVSELIDMLSTLPPEAIVCTECNGEYGGPMPDQKPLHIDVDDDLPGLKFVWLTANGNYGTSTAWQLVANWLQDKKIDWEKDPKGKFAIKEFLDYALTV